jgi:hypothetical protein
MNVAHKVVPFVPRRVLTVNHLVVFFVLVMSTGKAALVYLFLLFAFGGGFPVVIVEVSLAQQLIVLFNSLFIQLLIYMSRLVVS